MMFAAAPPQPFRLAEGGAIDRRAPLRFRFDGKAYQGFLGDTLASALLASGVRLVGRSFKYHRPRGVYTAGSEEPNALVQLRTGGRLEPNTRATMVELYGGLEATSQHRWPSLALDVSQALQLAAPFIPAGFYYKTFMGAPGWMFWEHWIRKAAGRGRAAYEPDPDRYDRMNAHCDVLVIGGGPAGLSAALAAGRAGARVMLLDENDDFGGRLRAERDSINGAPAMTSVRRIAAELDDLPGVTLLRRTTAFGRYDGNVVGAVERVSDHLAEPPPHGVRQRYWVIRARRIVLAAGATERPLVFAGNDKPGVMLAGAARAYANRFAVRPGNRAVIFANNDDGYRTAIDLAAAGMDIGAVVDPRAGGHGAWKARADALGIECLTGHAVAATHGFLSLSGIEVAALAPDGRALQGQAKYLSCDLLAVSGGWSPNVHLTSHTGGRPVWEPAIGGFVPGPGEIGETAGAARGTFSLAACMAEGFAAGAAAAEAAGFAVSAAPPLPETDEPAAGPLKPLWRVPTLAGRAGKAFVDLQDDVTADDIALAHREGYISVEHLKRYTTLGMGTDQGRTSNVNGHALMAEARGIPVEAVGTTTFRPPYTPVAMGAIAGRETGHHFAPVRRTALHHWHVAHGGVMQASGQWMRAAYYLQGGETNVKADFDRAIAREVLATRNGVGIVDVSTLGKIDIQGKDAGAFLNRIYANGFATLAVGRARYGLMLREDGIVLDDGTTSRLAENHYLMTTTTAEAGRVMSHIEEYLAVHWPDLDVKAVSVTEQWAGIALAGPRSRDVLAAVLDGHDVSNAALPYMGVCEATLGGIPARVFRISFSGELAYEINVPADHAVAAWERLLVAGQSHGIVTYGLEAMAIMRIEKGHVAGHELDGRVTADDLGMGRMAGDRKEYIGRRQMGRDGLVDPERPKLVGLVPVDGKTRPRGGAILVADPDAPPPVAKLGRVSSSAYLSPNLGHPVALGFVEGGLRRKGETVWAVYPLRGERVEVRIVEPVFWDPEGERLRA